MSGIKIMLVYIAIGGFRERFTGSVGDAPMLTDAGTEMSSSFADIRCIAMQAGVLVYTTPESKEASTLSLNGKKLPIENLLSKIIFKLIWG